MSRSFGWLVSLAVPPLLVALALGILASPAFLRWEYGRPHFPAAPGIDAQERQRLAEVSTRFILRPMPPAELAALEQGGQPLYTQAEVAHLVDVRRLVAILALLGLGGLGLILIAGLRAWRAGGGALGRWGGALARGGWLVLGLVLLTLLGLGLAWRQVFVGFHRLLFAPGTWAFPADSGLIRLFPEVFWYDSAIALVSLVLAQAGLLILLGTGLRRADRS